MMLTAREPARSGWLSLAAGRAHSKVHYLFLIAVFAERLMPTSTVEDYLKTIYQMQQRSKGKLVAMGKLAKAMNVTPGTATAMIKTLDRSNLVTYQPRSGVHLTDSGEQLALHVLRRHRLVELLLVEILGLDWSEVHDEAEELEHAISDKVLERIDDLLGRPSHDPHGDPIPDPQGQITRQSLRSLAACAAGDSGKVARVTDQDAKFLQFVDQRGLTPGVEIEVVDVNEAADAVTLQPVGGQPVTIGTPAAAKIMIDLN